MSQFCSAFDLLDRRTCNSKQIRRIYWRSFVTDVDWNVFGIQLCVSLSSRVEELHFKILHNIYPVHSPITEYYGIDETCSFKINNRIKTDLSSFIFSPTLVNHSEIQNIYLLNIENHFHYFFLKI